MSAPGTSSDDFAERLENEAQADAATDPFAVADAQDGTAAPEESIDDALEADRARAEGPGSDEWEGVRAGRDAARGPDDLTAAEQGNRVQDDFTTEEEREDALPDDGDDEVHFLPEENEF